MCIDYCHKVDLQIKAMGETTAKLMTTASQVVQGSEKTSVCVCVCVYIPIIPLCISSDSADKPQEMPDDCDVASNLGRNA